MTLLTTIQIGWVKLCATLNVLKDAINARTVIPGPGIQTSETPSGVMVSLVDAEKEKSMLEGQWITVDVVDAACSRTTIKIWALGPASGGSL